MFTSRGISLDATISGCAGCNTGRGGQPDQPERQNRGAESTSTNRVPAPQQGFNLSDQGHLSHRETSQRLRDAIQKSTGRNSSSNRDKRRTENGNIEVKPRHLALFSFTVTT